MDGETVLNKRVQLALNMQVRSMEDIVRLPTLFLIFRSTSPPRSALPWSEPNARGVSSSAASRVLFRSLRWSRSTSHSR